MVAERPLVPITRRRWRSGAAGLVLLAAVFLLLGGCGDAHTIRVLAASSLQDVLPEILDDYAEAHPETTFQVQFAGSQSLATQIELGAKADLFISANAQQFARLEADDLVGERTVIATNRLVVAVPHGSAIERVEDLARSGIRIAITAPDVPAGVLTEQALALLDFAIAEEIRAGVVTEDPNVRIALSRLELGEVDAAFVYLTDVEATADLRSIDLPSALGPNSYVAGVLESATADVADLLEHFTSDAAAGIWRAAGFEPVEVR